MKNSSHYSRKRTNANRKSASSAVIASAVSRKDNNDKQLSTTRAKTYDATTTGSNPRYGKKSYFFGGEFSIPTSNSPKALRTLDLAAACCEFALQAELTDVDWWVVYSHSDKFGNSHTLSINSTYQGRGGALQAGIVMIKKDDTKGMSKGQIAQMLDKEMQDYSAWLNAPLSYS